MYDQAGLITNPGVVLESISYTIYNNRSLFLQLRRVRTRFGLNSKTGMDPSPQSPCNKFEECRVKN